MKIKEEFETRQEALAYLEKRGWMLSTIFPSTGTLILSSNSSNNLRGIRKAFDNKWVIDRDQTFLRGL